MELFLNIVWVTLGATAIFAFFRNLRTVSSEERIPRGQALLAIACVFVLLFPFVSASDDLHPTQAVFEDSSKRFQQNLALVVHAQAVPVVPFLLLFVAATAPLLSTVWWLRQQLEAPAYLLERPRNTFEVRGPPTLSYWIS